MGVSNYVPNNALTQPGVCTSTTRPASPYEGQAIYETDTDLFLFWNGSAWQAIQLPPDIVANTLTATVGPVTSRGTSASTGIHTGVSGSPARFFSSAADNWNIRTHTNTPFPNFSLGVQDGAGSDVHVPVQWVSQTLNLRGAGTITTALEVNNSNYVRLPRQPTFVVSGGKTTSGPGFYRVEFPTIHYNDGGGYNASTGRFTCPAGADGWYFFSAQARLDSAGGNYIRGAIAKNGTLIWTPPNLHSINGNYHSTNYHSVTVAGVMFMLVGDYVEYWTGSDSATSSVQGESTFTGRYLG